MISIHLHSIKAFKSSILKTCHLITHFAILFSRIIDIYTNIFSMCVSPETRPTTCVHRFSNKAKNIVISCFSWILYFWQPTGIWHLPKGPQCLYLPNGSERFYMYLPTLYAQRIYLHNGSKRHFSQFTFKFPSPVRLTYNWFNSRQYLNRCFPLSLLFFPIIQSSHTSALMTIQ